MAPGRRPRFDVVGVGVAALDYVTRLERYPGPDEKLKTDELLIAGGGTVGTALVTASRLGLRAAFAGPVGDDPFGRQVLGGLEAEGVDVGLARVSPGARTTWAFCVAHAAERNVFSVRGTHPPMSLGAEELERALDCRLLHLDGSEEQASLELARAAQARGVLTSLDGGSPRATTAELLEQVDVCIVSAPFLAALFPGRPEREALAALDRPGRRVTAVTRGARGTLAVIGRELLEVPAEPVAVMVDTTGAGDVFHGAFIAALLEGVAIERALAFASHVAALKCRVLGGRAGIPRRKDVADWLPAAQDP